jgi:hypothetical protein
VPWTLCIREGRSSLPFGDDNVSAKGKMWLLVVRTLLLWPIVPIEIGLGSLVIILSCVIKGAVDLQPSTMSIYKNKFAK